MSNPAQQPLTPTIAYERLRDFVGELGWHGLRMEEWGAAGSQTTTDSERLNRHVYLIGEMDDDIYVQINSQLEHHPRLFAINAYALKCGICSGWHAFSLSDEASTQQAELTRMVLPAF